MPARGLTLTGTKPSAYLAVGVSQGSIGFLLASLGPCLILLARDLSVPVAGLSWLSAGFGVGLLLLGMTGSGLLRHAGARVLLRCSALCLAVGATLLATASWLFVAKLGALSLGLGGAGIVLSGWALLSGPAAGRRLTYVNAASSLSGICAPPLIGALDALSGHGRLALLVALPSLLWLAWASGSETGPPPAIAPEAKAHPHPPLRLLAARFASVVAAVSAEFAFVVWGAARLQASGLSASVAAASAVAFPIGMGVGRLIAPHFIGRAPLVGLGTALGIASGLVAAMPVPSLFVVAALLGAGFGIAPLFPLMLARFMGTTGLSARRGASLGTAASGTAVLGAPVLLSAVASHTSLRMGFLVAVVALAILVVLQFQGETHAAGREREKDRPPSIPTVRT